MRCPACDSEAVRAHHVRDRSAFHFQVIGDRECGSCGAVWNPGCSQTGAVGCMLGGLILLGACLAPVVFVAADVVEFSADGETIEVAAVVVLVALAGLYSLGYGIAVLLGRAGELRLLEHFSENPGPGAPAAGGDHVDAKY